MNWAILAALAATPPKPNAAAINATTKNPSAQRSIITSRQSKSVLGWKSFFQSSCNLSGANHSIPHLPHISAKQVVERLSFSPQNLGASGISDLMSGGFGFVEAADKP